jgi:protein HOOK3
MKAPSDDLEKAAALEMLLKEANKGRDRYQNDYLDANRQMLLAQAKLESILKGRAGNETQTALALRQQLDEVVEERNALSKDKQATDDAHADLVRQLTSARADLGLVDKDKLGIIASARDEARTENLNFSEQVTTLKEDLATLKERDRLHLEEIRRYVKTFKRF